MTQKTVYLSLTVQSNGEYYTLPLTPWLLALWLMTAMPHVAAAVETVGRAVSHIDSAVATLIITILSLIFIMEVRACSLS